jgi:hypothetical protein
MTVHEPSSGFAAGAGPPPDRPGPGRPQSSGERSGQTTQRLPVTASSISSRLRCASSRRSWAIARHAARCAAVRHSKGGPDDSALVFTGHEWTAFVAGVKAGEFDSF